MAVALGKKSDGADKDKKDDVPKEKKPAPKKTSGRRKPVPAGRIIRRVLGGLARLLVVWAPFVMALFAPRVFAAIGGKDEQNLVDYYLSHLGMFLVPVVPVVLCLAYSFQNYQRTHPPRTQSGKPKRPPQPRLPSLFQRIRDVTAIIATLDSIPWRLTYAGLFVGGVAMAGLFYPITVSEVQGVAGNPDTIRNLLLAVVGPLAAYTVIHMRTSSIIKQRQDQIDQVYAIARDTLGYPKRLPSIPTRKQRDLVVPWLAVDVKEWRSLFEVDKFFVMAPEELSVEDVKKWDDFDVNLNAKLPRDEEWRVQRDPRGRGATVGPANYPTAVLWDGEYDPDPLTFYLGTNLETGERQTLTLGEVSPHVACSGGTSSGKSSAAEIIAAQTLVKPMPWDPELHGMVVVVDPKGPFARRWRGRPGVVVADGQSDAAEPDDEGNPITGPMVMASCMEWLEEEHQRRAQVLARYPDVGTWVHLSDEVKRQERFFPILIVLDEYIDHTDLEKANGDERIEKENAARLTTTRLASWQARKVRNVGMHMFVIAQRVNMTIIGNVLMTNLPVRIVTGQMDDSQMRTMFQTEDIPNLPSTRIVYENGERHAKTIPGRARIMNALGQRIDKIQVMWFGGKTNSETLDKWLPRGEVPLNGDFSLPPGAPRTRADFDAEGNLINPEAPVAAHADAIEDLPMDGTEPSAKDFTPLDVPEHVDADEEYERDEGDDDPWGLSEIDVDADLSAVFPVAEASMPRCEHDECVNDADRKCSSCEKGYCQYHLFSSPDPEHRGLVCANCTALHPLTRSGVADAYRKMHDMGRDAGLTASYTVSGDGSEVHAVLRTPRAKKVIEVHGVEGDVLRARSRSGEVEGDDVYDRVDSAIESYQTRRAEASASEAS